MTGGSWQEPQGNIQPMSAWMIRPRLHILLCLGFLVGCTQDDGMADVSGSVKIDGENAPYGSSISFFPTDGKSRTAGATLIDGVYKVRVPLGENRVEIRAPRKMQRQRKITEGPGSELGGGDGGLVEEMLPGKFNNDSTLRFDVQPGLNEKDWELESRE